MNLNEQWEEKMSPMRHLALGAVAGVVRERNLSFIRPELLRIGIEDKNLNLAVRWDPPTNVRGVRSINAAGRNGQRAVWWVDVPCIADFETGVPVFLDQVRGYVQGDTILRVVTFVEGESYTKLKDGALKQDGLEQARQESAAAGAILVQFQRERFQEQLKQFMESLRTGVAPEGQV